MKETIKEEKIRRYKEWLQSDPVIKECLGQMSYLMNFKTPQTMTDGDGAPIGGVIVYSAPEWVLDAEAEILKALNIRREQIACYYGVKIATSGSDLKK